MTDIPMIPAVGRIVHYYDATLSSNGVDVGPFAAIITQVFGDLPESYANLLVFTPFGVPHHAGSVGQKDQPSATPARYWVQPPRVNAF